MDLRRLRSNKLVRDLAQEISVRPEKLIQPLFVVEGISKPEPISGLTDVHRESSESLIRQIESDMERGVRKFLLFGVPQDKTGNRARLDFSFTARQISEIKKKFGPHLWLAVDVCLCSSMEHGHCGILNSEKTAVDNEESVRFLTQAALEYSQAGADCVAPSDMMDGRVGSIRQSLDQNDQSQTLIMSYSAKFNSKFYGPFREAAESAPNAQLSENLKDRATYQIDPSRPSDALLSSLRDAQEGADILMVKPGLPYLDILSTLSKEIKKPWAVYEVSGEFAAIELLAQQGLINAGDGHLESWTSLFRAGASTVITYGARNAREWLS